MSAQANNQQTTALVLVEHGLRELRLDDGGHHLHLDLKRLTRAHYVITPSVCYGFGPSFELRLAAEGADPFTEYGVGLAIADPYSRSKLRKEAVLRYLSRAAEHHASDRVAVRCWYANASGAEESEPQRKSVFQSLTAVMPELFRIFVPPDGQW